MFSFDGSDWAEEEILALIKSAREAALAKSVTLKGVRVAGDIFIRLGGSNVAYPNAREEDGVLLVQMNGLGTVELVFET